MIYVLIIIIFFTTIYIYWRYFYFFRDPKRKIPEGKNIVAPADGTIVYIRKVMKNETPISIKKGRSINISEIIKSEVIQDNNYFIVGIFMHPTSVHINRSPINGIVEDIYYTNGRNLPMTLMWWRILLGIKPFETGSGHIISNERNVIKIKGSISIFVIQIADIYVNKIVCYIKKGFDLKKGQKIGAIKMGSQVDLIFPIISNLHIKIEEGQKVFAGESIIAEY